LQPDADALLAQARRRTGLEDFGADNFEAPLRVLVDAMRGEANLTERAMQSQLREIVSDLCVNLRTHAFFASHPEIELQPIVAPVVIVGLQRTGTSKLFRNIAADPQWNVLYTWLALNPIPSGAGERGQGDPRIAEAEAWCASRRWMAKGHAFYPTAPEMEALLMKRTFMLNTTALLTPTHQAWLEKADFAPAYRYLKRQLQFLQWQMRASPGRRWILKSPPHLLTLPALMEIFPDARLVMTHRHPRASVGSMFKLVELAQQNSAKAVNRDLIRDFWLRNLSLAISRFMSFRGEAGNGLLLDVGFSQIIDDPLSTISRIYAHAGVPFTAQAQAKAREWHVRNPRFSEGKFEYDLADYGATGAEIDRIFQAYLSQYAAFL
jgi:hypothetical protein